MSRLDQPYALPTYAMPVALLHRRGWAIALTVFIGSYFAAHFIGSLS